MTAFTPSDDPEPRHRVTVFTPSYVKPLTCNSDSSGTSLQCTGGYPVPESTQTQESYVVAPDTVLADEPGWLPPGTDNVLQPDTLIDVLG